MEEWLVSADGREYLSELAGLCASLAGVFLGPENPNRAGIDGNGAPPEDEYDRLFLPVGGGANVPLYESVLRYDSLMTPGCIDPLLMLYELAGPEFRPAREGPPDHLGAQIEFLALLLRQIAETQEKARLDQLRVAALELLNGHLFPFAEAFVKRLTAAKAHEHFAKAGQLLLATLYATQMSVNHTGSLPPRN